MEQYYFLDIRDLPDPASDQKILEDLPDDRRNKCLKFRSVDDRKRCCGAGIVIHRMLDGAPYYLGTNGKPETRDQQFSVSHAGQYVIGIRSDSAVGCDIEFMGTPRKKVASHYFSDRQNNYIYQDSDEAAQKISFWRIWTLSESYMKMTGEGLTLSLRKFEVVISSAGNMIGAEPEGSVRRFTNVEFVNCISGNKRMVTPYQDKIQVYREGILQPCELLSLSCDEYMIGLCRNTGKNSNILL